MTRHINATLKYVLFMVRAVEVLILFPDLVLVFFLASAQIRALDLITGQLQVLVVLGQTAIPVLDLVFCFGILSQL